MRGILSRRHWPALLLAVVFTACGGADQTDGVISSDSNAALPTSTPTLSPEERPTLEDDGIIMYVDDDDLFALADGQSQLVAAEVGDHVWAPPSSQAVIYATPIANHNHEVFAIKYGTLEPQSIGVVSSMYTRIDRWSPDGRWLLFQYAFGGPLLIRHDGEASISLTELAPGFSNVSDILWLNDGSLLVGELRYRSGGDGTSYQRVGHVEPDVPRLTRISHAEQYDSLEEIGATLNLQPASRSGMSGYILRMGLPGDTLVRSPRTCDTWRILGPGGQIYSASGVYNLTDLTPTNDGRLFFIEWAYPDCKLSLYDPPDMKLMMIPAQSRQATTVVSEGLSPNFPGARGDESELSRFAVSPTGDQVLWIGGSLEEGYSTLNLTAIDRAHSVTILRQLVNPATGAGVIRSVHWLAE